MIREWIASRFGDKTAEERRRITYETLRRLGQSCSEHVAEAISEEHAGLYPTGPGVKYIVEKDLNALARQGRIRRMPVSRDVDTDEGIVYEAVA